MDQSLVRLPLVGILLSCAGFAADYRDCKELFVSPLAVKPPDRKATGAVWDEGSPMDPELSARPKERADVGFKVIGPKLQDTAAPAWNELMLSSNSVGGWLPIRVGDALQLRLVDRDAFADDTIVTVETTIPKSLAETGVVFLRLGGLEGSPMTLRISVSDGKRSCAGVEGETALRYEIPNGVFALPDKALFASVAKHNRCSVNQASPACRLDAYRVVFGDVNGDSVPDTLGQGGPFGGTAGVVYFAVGYDPASRKEIYVGDCEKTGFLKEERTVTALTCTSDGATTLVPLDGSPVRPATEKELAASDTNTAEARAAEARSNLKAVFVAEKAFYAEKDRYSVSSREVGFLPEMGNRYAYFLSARGDVERRDGKSPRPLDPVVIGPDQTKYKDAVLPSGLKEAGCPLTFGTNADGEPIGLGVTGAAPNQEFIAYAVGNVDEDEDLDCWSIATFERKTKAGEVISAGMPLHEKSDYLESTASAPKAR